MIEVVTYYIITFIDFIYRNLYNCSFKVKNAVSMKEKKMPNFNIMFVKCLSIQFIQLFNAYFFISYVIINMKINSTSLTADLFYVICKNY